MSDFANFKNGCRIALKGILAHPVLLVILCHAWIAGSLDCAGNPVLAPVFAFLSVFVDRLCKGRTGWSWILVPLYVGSCYINAFNGFDNTVSFVVICATIIPPVLFVAWKREGGYPVHTPDRGICMVPYHRACVRFGPCRHYSADTPLYRNFVRS